MSSAHMGVDVDARRSPYTSCITTSVRPTTLRVTPAIEAGVASHVSHLEEVVGLLG